MFDYVKNYGLKFSGALVPRNSTKRILLHHTSGGEAETVQGIHAYHLSKGHKGIDYNICVEKDGTVSWGRGLEYCGGSVNNVAAGTKGMNNDSVAIAALGDFEHNQMPEAQKEALKRVTKDVAAYYGITEIKGHNEVAGRDYTDCPGKYFPLDEVRNYAIGSAPVAPTPQPEPQPRYEFALTQLVSTKSGSYDEIKAVQRTLNDYGYGLAVDGIFGSKSKAAVMDFQRNHGLKADGVVGKNTCEALNGRWDG